MNILKRENRELYNLALECFEKKEFIHHQTFRRYLINPQTPKHYKRIIFEYTQHEAEKNQNNYAQYLLSLFFFGNIIKKLKNPSKSFYWASKSAETNSPYGLNALGTCYHNGFGVQKNIKKAISYYKKGNQLENPDSMRNLAICYQYGFGIQINSQTALRLIQRAIDHGSIPSQVNLGVCYHTGSGVLQDNLKAFQIFKKASEENDPDAIRNLGICYHNGYGTPPNIFEAYLCYKKANELGDIDSFVKLGICFQFGIAVEKDNLTALELYKKGSDLGNEDATKRFQTLKLQDPRTFNLFKENIKKKEKKKMITQKVFLLLLCARQFQPKSLFWKEFLPLDLFKLILREAGLKNLKSLPNRNSKKYLFKKVFTNLFK